jgi:predicted O-linked N-acetylglucosamine transferase (SPINDLY family)
LTDWIASSPEDYVRRAVRFAGERERLAELRAAMRRRMAVSPLMDEVRFVRDLEAAYRQMWRTWCAGNAA